MSAWLRLSFALRLFWRELRSGELLLLALALVLAVAAMSGVAFFSDRVERGLSKQATQLMAADLVVNANQPLPRAWGGEAARRGLRQSETVSFPSMVMGQGDAVLATIKAVGPAYPLRGEVTVRHADGRVLERAQRPAPGEAWADARLMSRLGVPLGGTVNVGSRSLRLSAEILREPDGALDLYNFVPRLMMAEADLASTGLIQPATRARYRLLAAGDAAAVEGLRTWLKPQLAPGMRLEDIEEARPEVRVAMERARRFLGMTAMLTVALASAAVALAVRRYLARHWQSVAVLRCLGLTGTEVWQVFALLFVALGLGAALLGGGLGYLLQQQLLAAAGQWVGNGLPAPGPRGWLLGLAAALVLLAGFALPALMGLRHVAPVLVLRQELPPPRKSAAVPLAAALALLALSAWQVGDPRLAVWLIAALAGFVAVAGGAALALLWLLARLGRRGGLGWRHGAANLVRRPWLALIQVVALAVGLMALLLLTVVRADLISAWQHSLPADTPNRFVINLQAAQRADFADAFLQEARPAPEVAPMVKARLTAINNQALDPRQYRDDEARRLAEREFNLSWRDDEPPGNRIVAGRWWPRGERAKPQFSVERRLAERLGIRMGDVLTFDVAGTEYEARVTSLREVAWDSFRVNFFVLGPAAWFAGQDASYITSFRLDEGDADFSRRLVARFPNITLIDVSAILAEVRALMDRLAGAVELMFTLALSAGVLVLWTALLTTRDERLADLGLMRALGASRRQLQAIAVSELMWLGLITGVVAGAGAMLTGAVLAVQLFDLPWRLNALLPLYGVAGGLLVVLLAGAPPLLRVIRRPPLAVLRGI